MQNIISFIVFVLILGFSITIHELGHFLVAKHFKVFCSQFSIGMGPKIWAKKIGETNYELRALPIGGFVAMAGEADQEDNDDMKDVPLERTLKGIAPWKKITIFLAGVFMNFVSAFIIIILVYAIAVPMATNSSTIGSIVEGAPAQAAGIQESDTITAITVLQTDEQHLIGSFSDLGDVLNKEKYNYEGDVLSLKVTVSRDYTSNDYFVEATYNEASGNYYLGVGPTTRKLTLMESFKYGGDYFVTSATLVFTTIGKLITDSSKTVSQLSGPVGIYQVVGQVTSTGSFSNIMLLVAMLGINLGVFNLLPIPGLDGSQVLFTVVEKIIGREIPTKFKFGLQLIGLFLVFGLMIVVTINDIIRIF